MKTAADAVSRNEPVATTPADALSGMIEGVFENCGCAVFGVDARGHIGYWNPLFEQLLDLPQNVSIIGKHSSDLLCGGDKLCRENNCPACALGKNIRHQEQINDFSLTLSRSDGHPVRVNIGTCYFYQPDDRALSTYFSLDPVNE
jgi:PAS domain-containing protein